MTYLYEESKLGFEKVNDYKVLVKFKLRVDNDESDKSFYETINRLNFGEDTRTLYERSFNCHDAYEYTNIPMKYALYEITNVETKEESGFIFMEATIESMNKENSKKFFNLMDDVSFGLRAIGTRTEDGNFKIDKLLAIDVTIE